MTLERNINVLLTGNSTGLDSTLAKSGAKVKTFEKTVQSAGTTTSKAGAMIAAGFKYAGLAIALALAAGIAAAISFEAKMRNVNSISKLSEEALGALSAKVLALSQTLPQSSGELAEGLYDIASSGFQGAEGITVLAASAKAASAGLSDTATAARAITAVINAYGLEAEDASYISDVLFQTVNLGVITFSELAGVIGNFIGTTAAAKVPVGEAAAAIAAMTLAGVDAAEAGTSLNRVVQSFIVPSAAMQSSMAQLGFESGATMLETLGLHGSLEALRKTTKGNITEIVALFPEMRAMRGVLALAANDGQNYAKTWDAIAKKHKVAGATESALAEQSKALAYQLKLAKNTIVSTLIEIGQAALPTVAGGFTAFMDGLRSLIDVGKRVATAVAPGFEALSDALRNVAGLASEVIAVLKPMLLILGGGAIAAAAVVFNVLGSAVEQVTSFFKKGTVAGKALAVVLGGVLLSKILQATVAMGAFVASAALDRISLLVFKFALSWGPVLQSVGAASGAMAKFSVIAAGAGKALLSFALTTGPLLLATAAVIGLGQGMAESKQHGEDFVATIKKASNFDAGNIDSYRQSIDNLNTAFNGLALKREAQQGSFWETLKGLGDLLIPFSDIDNTLADTQGKITATVAEVERLQAQYVKLHNSLILAAQGSSGLAAEISDPRWQLAQLIQVRARDKIEKLTKALDDGKISFSDYTNGVDKASRKIEQQQPILDRHRKRVNEILQVYMDFASSHGIELPEPDASADAWDKWGKAVGTAFETSTNLTPQNAALAAAFETLSSQVATTTEKLDAYKAALDAALGAPLDLRSAQADLGTSVRDFSQSLKDNGLNLDVWTEKGAALQGSMAGVKDKLVAIAVETAKQQGIPAATKQFGEWVDRIKQGARDAGILESDIESLITTMGLTPQDLEIALALADPEGAREKLEGLRDTAKDLELRKTIKIGALTYDADKNLKGLQVQVTDMTGQKRWITVDADTMDADVTLDGFQVKWIDQYGNPITATVDAQTEDADLKMAGLQLLITNIDGSVSIVTIKPEAADVAPTIAGVQQLMQNVDGTTSLVTVSATEDATSKVAQARSALDSIHGKTVSTSVLASLITTKKQTGVPFIEEAHGGIVKFYGSGGVENHVAQYARAGDWRVWAEPETGGESYIPWAQSKRQRSTEVLRQTAAGFGYGLVPQASGGILQRYPVGNATASIVVQTTNIWQGPVYGGDAMKRAATDVAEARDRQLALKLRSRR